MIKQYFWKDKLDKLSLRIEELVELNDINDENIYAELEFCIISGFFAIRKLKENNKLTNKFTSNKIKKECYKYPFIKKKNITPINNHKFDEFYDFLNKQNAEFDISFLCNQFVHSYYFIPCIATMDEDGNSIEIEEDDEIEKYNKKYSSILFNSDSNKCKFLFEIEINTILDIFKTVSNMNITSIQIKRKNDKWITINSDEDNELPESLKKIIEEREGGTQK